MDSSYFETRYVPHRGRTQVWKAIAEYLQKFIEPSSVVADIGAGYCDFINQIRAREKYAVDSNADVSKWCGPDVKFVRASPIQSLEIGTSCIDAVMISNLLEHLTRDECNRLFDRLDTTLTAAGKIIVIQPNYFYCYRTYWDDFTHVRAFSHVSLADYLRSRGYKVAHLEKRFVPFSFKSRLPKSYRLTKLYLASPWRPGAAQMLIVAQR